MHGQAAGGSWQGLHTARMALSLSRLASSAPEYPIVSSATLCSSASSSCSALPDLSIGLLRACTCRAGQANAFRAFAAVLQHPWLRHATDLFASARQHHTTDLNRSNALYG